MNRYSSIKSKTTPTGKTVLEMKIFPTLTKQDDDVGPTSDSKSTKVKYRGGPMAPTSEETVAEAIGIKKVIRNVGSKLLTKLGHGSDEDMKKDLQRKMGVPQTGKKPSDK